MRRFRDGHLRRRMGGIPVLVHCALIIVLLTGCTAPGPDQTPERKADDSVDVGDRTPVVSKEPGKPHPPGRWNRVRHRDTSASESSRNETMARLEAIGYVSGSREAGVERGTTVHDGTRAGKGYNLYTSGHGPEAVLMDMAGQVLHRWRYSCRTIWPDPDEPLVPRKGGTPRGKAKKMADSGTDVEFFRNIHLFPNGDLLVIFEGRGLIKLDKDSNLIWANRCGAHHDLDVRDNGDILVLTRKARINPLVSDDQPILEDFITTLDSNGREKGRLSLLECFARSPWYEEIWRSSENRVGDIFHTNTLFLLRETTAAIPPAFVSGRVLTSMRSLHCVAVVDLEEEKVVWARTGRFKAQHDPRLLANGNLLLFDNLGVPGRSRVLEFDLEKWQPLWSYRGTPRQPFFSETCGTCQRLANGNTLVAESDGGRAFEVTPGGEIVWEFWNPHRAGDRQQFIASLFTIRRLESDFPVHWASGCAP